MVLADVDIRERLADLDIATSNPNFPFEEKQIQPCSVDLRLSELVWKPRLFRSLDLSDKTPLGPKIANAFRRTVISEKHGMQIRPGEFILARSYERFTIPGDLCGQLLGRTSLGRLGLSVVSPSNLINPGWRGHMPLMLINHSPFTVRIFPYLGVVQLCLMNLSREPKNKYGVADIGSKYIDDDGGPSKYWLDYTIETLRNSLNLKKVDAGNEKIIERYSAALDEPTRSRFLTHLKKSDVINDLDRFFEGFITKERMRSALIQIFGILLGGVLLGGLVTWLPELMKHGLRGQAVGVAFILLAISLVVWIFRALFASTLSPGELRRLADDVRG